VTARISDKGMERSSQAHSPSPQPDGSTSSGKERDLESLAEL